MGIVDRIKNLQLDKCGKVSLNALEVELGIGKSTISRWDEKEPSIGKLKKVADYFNVSTDYLLGRETPEVDRSAAMLQNVNILDELPPEALEDIDEFIMFTKQKYSK